MNSIPLYIKLIIATAEIIAAWIFVSFLRFLLIEIYEKYAKKGRYSIIESKVVPKIVTQNAKDNRIQLVCYFISFGLWGLDEFFLQAIDQEWDLEEVYSALEAVGAVSVVPIVRKAQLRWSQRVVNNSMVGSKANQPLDEGYGAEMDKFAQQVRDSEGGAILLEADRTGGRSLKLLEDTL
jgi:hypothetical protein